MRERQTGLDQIIQINSQKSGLCLNNLDVSDSLGIICQLTPFLAAQFYEQSKQNVSLVIKNGEVRVFLYTLTTFEEDKNIKLFYFWDISTKLKFESRENWCRENGLELYNCCYRNALIAFGENADFYFDDHRDLDRFCHFPKKFVDAKSFYYSHLLDAQNEKIKKDFYKRDLNCHFVSTNNVFGSSVPNRTQFLSGSRLRQNVDLNSLLKKVADDNSIPNLNQFVNIPPSFTVSPSIDKWLKKLGNDSLTNYNCKNLLLDLSLENQTFESFLFSCFITVYKHQLSIIKNRKQTKMDIKVLFCDFFF